MNKSIIALLVASSMIALGAPPVAADDGPEPDPCPVGGALITVDPCTELGECMNGTNPACEGIAACLAGGPPCNPPGAEDFYFDLETTNQCLMLCDPPTLNSVVVNEDVLVEEGMVTVYVTNCRIGTATYYPTVSTTGHTCFGIGIESCGVPNPCTATPVPEEDIEGGVEPEPLQGVPPVGSICRAYLWLTVAGFTFANGEPTQAPCEGQ